MTFNRRGRSPLGAFVRSPLGVLGQEDSGPPPPPPYTYTGTAQDMDNPVYPPEFGTRALAYRCTSPTGQVPQIGTGPAGQLWGQAASLRTFLFRTAGPAATAQDIAHEIAGLRYIGQTSGAIFDPVLWTQTTAECSGNLSLGRGYAIYWSTDRRFETGGDPWPLVSVKGYASMWGPSQHAGLVAFNGTSLGFIAGETLTCEVARAWPPTP